LRETEIPGCPGGTSSSFLEAEYLFSSSPGLTLICQNLPPTNETGLAEEGISYKGFIFFGLINVEGEPYVIEYNARLGDPETEVVIPRIKSDLVDLLEGVANGDLEKRNIELDERFVTTVMLVSGGYPGDYEKEKTINGLENVKDSVVFHAGTKTSEGKVVSAGGRVLSVTSWGVTMKDALSVSYRNCRLISFDGMYFRNDIGFDLHE
jgi:phosphoribosylamine--glycine ligase